MGIVGFQARHVLHVTVRGDAALIRAFATWLAVEGIEPATHGSVRGEELYAADFIPEDAERVATWLKEHGVEETEWAS